MLVDALRKLDQRLGIGNRLRGLPRAGFDLAGEKVLDWSWCVANLPQEPGLRVLDLGCAEGPISLAAATMGHSVIGIDLAVPQYVLSGFEFRQGDFLDYDFGPERFDIVIACSVIEHIGLPGRYAQRNFADGDLQAMEKIALLMKPTGILILTVPVGKDMVLMPWHRIYGPVRLPLLLQRFTVRKERFFAKEPKGKWYPVDRNAALQVDRNGLSYALGQFVLAL